MKEVKNPVHEIHLPLVDSTNQYAKDHSHSFPKEQISCIFADEQTKGRGRYQRSWLSLKDKGLYATFYFTLPSDFYHLISLAQLMTLSLAKVVQKKKIPLAHISHTISREGVRDGASDLLTPGRKHCQNDKESPGVSKDDVPDCTDSPRECEKCGLEIKWPNDLRIQGKKFAGVLCETRFQKDEVEIFLGVGVNLNHTEKDLASIDQPTTSLFIETKNNWNKIDLLHELQQQFLKDLSLFKQKGFTPFYQEMEKLLALKGQMIQCYDGKKTWKGICHSLTEDGQLNLLLENRTLHKLLSGDIL